MDRHQGVLDAMFDSVVAVDRSGALVAVNRAAEELFGYSREQAIGQQLHSLLVPERFRDRHLHGFARLVETGDSPVLNSRMEVTAQRSDGSEVPIEITVTKLDDVPGTFMAVLRDLSQEKHQMQQLEDLARENAQIVASAGDGILRFDPQGVISYANPAAAQLLERSADELEGKAMHQTMHHSHADGSRYPAEECPLLAALTGEVCHITTEVFWRGDGTSFPADYTGAPIRENGEIVGGVCVFADMTEQRAREEHLRERAEWSAHIHRGLRDALFVMHAQPIVDLATGEPLMHELLIRMHDAEGGYSGPAGFLPQAEEFDLMGDIDRWVVGEAVRIARHRPVSVNISGHSVADAIFTSWVQRTIEEAAVPPENLLFEITETAALSDLALARKLVSGLTDLGCRFALDDFATGFGTFTELKHLPVTHLKIDMSFVRDLPRSSEDRRIVTAIVHLAQSFDMKTIAEGVEEQRTVELLSELGVDYAQGYLLGRPAPIDERAAPPTEVPAPAP